MVRYRREFARNRSVAAVDVLPLDQLGVRSEDDSFGSNIKDEDGTRRIRIVLLLRLKVLHRQWCEDP